MRGRPERRRRRLRARRSSREAGDETQGSGRESTCPSAGTGERGRRRRQQRDAGARTRAGRAGGAALDRTPPPRLHIGRDRLRNEDDNADGGEREPGFWERRGQTDTVESFVMASSVMLSRRDRSDTLDCHLGDMGHVHTLPRRWRYAFTTAPSARSLVERVLSQGAGGLHAEGGSSGGLATNRPRAGEV